MKTSLLSTASAFLLAGTTLLAPSLQAESMNEIKTAPCTPALGGTCQKNQQSSEANRAANGGADAGGGAFARDANGQLITLAEAGLVFDRVEKLIPTTFPDIFLLSPELRKEIRTIVLMLPFTEEADKRKLFNEIIQGEHRDTFLPITAVDSIEYNSIKDSYATLIASYGKELDAETFALAAYSKSGKTYVIEPVFKDLSLRRQALNIIHEYFMRTAVDLNVSERLARTMEIEILLQELLKPGRSNDLALQLRLMKAFEAFDAKSSKLDMGIGIKISAGATQVRLNHAYIYELQRLVGRPLLLSEFVMEPTKVIKQELLGDQINPSLVQKNFSAQLPHLATSLKNMRLRRNSHNLVSLFSQTIFNDIHWPDTYYPVYGTYWAVSNYLRFAFSAKEAKEIAASHQATFNQLCKSTSELLASSDVPNDALMYLDPKSGILFEIDCKPYGALVHVIEVGGITRL